jgi:hypothetical protein
MSLDIDINVRVEKLKAKIQDISRANRVTLERKEDQVKTQKKAVEKRARQRIADGTPPGSQGLEPTAPPSVRSISASGRSPSTGRRVDEEPGARKRSGGRGGFRYMIASGRDRTGAFLWGDPAYSEDRAIYQEDSFSFSPKDVPTVIGSDGGRTHLCGVIYVGGGPNECSYTLSVSQMFQYRPQELVDFVVRGGVLWVQNEWIAPAEDSAYSGFACGRDVSEMNSYIQGHFGTTMQFERESYSMQNRVTIPDDGLPEPIYEADENYLVYQTPGFQAPGIFYTNFYARISGGTMMYRNFGAPGSVVAFERIGKGFVVLSADSNGTAVYPTLLYMSSGFNFIDALRTLK